MNAALQPFRWRARATRRFWSLPAGQHTLQIAYREDGAQVDAIVIMGVE